MLDSKMKQGGLKFFNSIRIPFKCKLSANQTISQGLNPMLNRLLTWKNGTGYLEIRLLLAYTLLLQWLGMLRHSLQKVAKLFWPGEFQNIAQSWYISMKQFILIIINQTIILYQSSILGKRRFCMAWALSYGTYRRNIREILPKFYFQMV